MAMQHIQNIFSSGELDPGLRARIDKPFYGNGARLMRNFCPVALGGVTRRPGTRFLGKALNAKGRLIPFTFSASQGRVLEFGDKVMRVWMPDGSFVMKNGAVYEVATPYPLAALPDVRFAQSADVIYFVHPDYPPQKLGRYADDDWRWSVPAFKPEIVAPVISGVAMQGKTESTVDDRDYRYVVTAVDKETGQESSASAEKSVKGKLLTSNYFPRITWGAVAGAAYYKVYKYSGGVYGFIGRADGTSFDDTNIAADQNDSPLKYENPFAAAGDYPSQVFFFQQRLGFASTRNRPVTFWLSRTAEFECFAASVPPQDDDSIEVTLAATEAAVVAWCRPDRTALAFGTESSEWTLQPSSGAVLTPASCSFQPQSSVGGESLPAASVGGNIVYIQRASKAVRGFGYQYNVDKYVGADLTILARHLLRDTSIKAWAYQQEPYSILWCVTEDGKAIAMTVMQDQEVQGWHRHETDGRFLDVVSIPGTPDDQLWFLVERNGVAMVERLEVFFTSGELADARYLDSAMTYEGTAQATFSGLGHLAGREVVAFADGSTVSGLKVTADGKLTLPRAVRSMVVGLPYTSELVPNMAEGEGTLMHNKTVKHARFRVVNSMTFEAGVEAMHAVVDRQTRGGRVGLEPFYAEQTDLDAVIGSGWLADYPLTVRVATPTPLTILAVCLSIDVAKYTGRAS